MFTNDLVLRDTGDGVNFKVEESLSYVYNYINTIVIPEGFITDLASISRLLRLIIPKNGKYNRASVFHDYMYKHKKVYIEFSCGLSTSRNITRLEADNLYLDMMKLDNVRLTKRWAIYAGVRIGGWIYWNECKHCS